jgi:DMSO/TMAO reductase YedYZ molybdopterin-dependent catalytic subunit
VSSTDTGNRPVPSATDAPENLPTPHAALLDPVTSTADHYRRSHFPYPQIDPRGWRLQLTGAVRMPLRLTLDDLCDRRKVELPVVLECAGHRRTEFDPPVAGVAWETGAVGQAVWSGTSLGELLREAGLLPDAAEVVLYGADHGKFGSLEGEFPYARSLPLHRALHPDTLLALHMNGEPLPRVHGAPVRAVVPGWYAMDSVKWLTRVEVVTEPFRGPFQELDYRFQPAGETGIGERLAKMPISALILTPLDGANAAGSTAVAGIAWGGDGGPFAVELRVDDGPWRRAALEPPRGLYTKRNWKFEYVAPARPHVLAACAIDAAGKRQPDHLTWNRRGYGNNSIHRIRLLPSTE